VLQCLLTFASAILVLLLLAAAALLWIRGYWAQDLAQVCYTWCPQPNACKLRWFSLRSANGRFEFAVVRNDFPDLLRYSRMYEPGWIERYREENQPGFSWHHNSTPLIPGHRYATVGDGGFGFGHRHQDHPGAERHDEYWTLSVPAWFLILITALAPSVWLRRRLRQRYRATYNLCLTCGYDLRASTDRCPECGTAVTMNGLKAKGTVA
jgi:hypothetical protein